VGVLIEQREFVKARGRVQGLCRCLSLLGRVCTRRCASRPRYPKITRV